MWLKLWHFLIWHAFSILVSPREFLYLRTRHNKQLILKQLILNSIFGRRQSICLNNRERWSMLNIVLFFGSYWVWHQLIDTCRLMFFGNRRCYIQNGYTWLGLLCWPPLLCHWKVAIQYPNLCQLHQVYWSIPEVQWFDNNWHWWGAWWNCSGLRHSTDINYITNLPPRTFWNIMTELIFLNFETLPHSQLGFKNVKT